MRRFILHLAVSLLAFITVGQALSVPITGGAVGIANPVKVITFDELGNLQGQVITNQFAPYGATFQNFGWDNSTLGQTGSTGFAGGCLVNGIPGFPGGTPMAISFPAPVIDAAFAAVDQNGTYAITSYLNGVQVETFQVLIPYNPGVGFLGFASSFFDEIRIQPLGPVALSIDTLQIIDYNIDIDIKPGSDPNAINVENNGVIPVAILGSDTFDVTDVDVTTLDFMGAAPDHDLTDPLVYAEHIQDVNGDGFYDLLSHYRTQDTTIVVGDTMASLTGATLGGQPIQGMDYIKTVGGPKPAPSAISVTTTWGKIRAR